MFGFKKKSLPLLITEEHTFEKYQAIFKTIDGETHNTGIYKWVNASNISCSVPYYLMIDCKRLTDEKDIMFPLCNIISIEWKIISTRKQSLLWDKWGNFQVYYTTKELDEIADQIAKAEKTLMISN